MSNGSFKVKGQVQQDFWSLSLKEQTRAFRAGDKRVPQEYSILSKKPWKRKKRVVRPKGFISTIKTEAELFAESAKERFQRLTWKELTELQKKYCYNHQDLRVPKDWVPLKKGMRQWSELTDAQKKTIYNNNRSDPRVPEGWEPPPRKPSGRYGYGKARKT